MHLLAGLSTNMGWVWQDGKSGGKGQGKDGKSRNSIAGKPSANGNAGKPSAKEAGKGGKGKKVYVYCNTPDCNGRVFLGPQPLPEKCKVCHFCDAPFVFPRIGKGGGIGQGRDLKKSGGPTTSGIPAATITRTYENLIAGGLQADQASAVLQDLGHVVPKPPAPKQPTDAYAKISKLNGEITTLQNVIEQKKDKHKRLSLDLAILFDDITARQLAVDDLIADRSIQMADLPKTTSIFPTVNVKPPEVAEYLREVEADWERLIEFGNSVDVPDDQKPFMKQFSLLRDRTLQACKLQHEHVAFPSGSLGADAEEIASVGDGDAVAEIDGDIDDDSFPPEWQTDANLASSSSYPDLASRQEVNKRQGLILARPKRKQARAANS